MKSDHPHIPLVEATREQWINYQELAIESTFVQLEKPMHKTARMSVDLRRKSSGMREFCTDLATDAATSSFFIGTLGFRMDLAM
ncbi:hypothetical protein Y032_0233g3111 [Ancylostoma ceylanicum]|uniref:Uncharacterized protein n=1 Tax=Ancylostoma ceylanicum TaxID=53326 RepID=A0A016SFF2_9BILA|nr:hypothetical protein Y032_0233g3111 [Ancylostoma ceylanicum]